MDKLLELLIEPFLVLITLLAWIICAGLMGSVAGSVVPLVGGLLIFALPHWRSKQRFIALELLRRNESAPQDSVASRADRDELLSSAPVQAAPAGRSWQAEASPTIIPGRSDGRRGLRLR
jgi:hypothetical protein